MGKKKRNRDRRKGGREKPETLQEKKKIRI
jgi:hypothetical protein